MKIDLDRIAFIGRTFKEYRAIFGLGDDVLKSGRILDCPAGASSFTAEAHALGYDATACDLLYGMDPAELINKARADTGYALAQAYKVKDLYNWDFYGGVDGHRAERMEALDIFSRDFVPGLEGGRYVRAELPSLPFEDGKFALVLSGHFLFLYSDRLDFDFHVAAIRELLRVGREVRIFPVFGMDGKPYSRLDELIGYFRNSGFDAGLREVPFEFVKGGTKMLRVWKKAAKEQ